MQLEILDILLLIFNDMMKETVRCNFVGSDKMHSYFLNNCPSFCAERTIPLKVQIVQKSILVQVQLNYIFALLDQAIMKPRMCQQIYKILGIGAFGARASRCLQIQNFI